MTSVNATNALTALPPLTKGPLTSSHVVRWCAAQQNWDKIHYDERYARAIAGLEGRLINGAYKQHVLVQFIERALPGALLLRMDFRFRRPDLVGDVLEVRGQVAQGAHAGLGPFHARVSFAIHNLSRDEVSTTGEAEVGLAYTGFENVERAWPGPLLLGEVDAVDESAHALAAELGVVLGVRLDRIESAYPLDLSRLRLFAHAVEDVPPVHYDAGVALAAGWPAVPAPILFPVHALELRPGELPLDTSQTAMGREAVVEAGRALGERWGLPAAKMLNGGSRVRFFSNLLVGERVVAESSLVSCRFHAQAPSGGLASLEFLNRYATSGGRRLLHERFTVLYRDVRYAKGRFLAPVLVHESPGEAEGIHA